MQNVLKQAIEQMVMIGNALNWNPPVDREYVNALNGLRALRDATQPSLHPTCAICGDTGVAGPTWSHPEGEACDCTRG